MTDHTALELLLHGAAQDWNTLIDPTRSDLDREVAALRLCGAGEHPEAQQYLVDGLILLDGDTRRDVELVMLTISQKMLTQMAVELSG